MPDGSLCRSVLLGLRDNSYKFEPDVAIQAAKCIEYFIRPRGNKSGLKRTNAPWPIERSHIEPIYNNTAVYQPGVPTLTTRPSGVNWNNLVKINKVSSYDQPKNLSVGLWNARSINTKVATVCADMAENKIDIFALTETWLSEKQQCVVNQIRSALPGYKIHQCSGSGWKGGGVGVIIRQDLKVKVNSSVKFTSFELLDPSIYVKSELIHLVVIYRPPPSQKNGLKVSQFFLSPNFFRRCSCVSRSPIDFGGFQLSYRRSE